MATEIQKEYQLSTEILGHTGDVRAVTSFNVPEEPADYIVTASRDRSACLWVREAGETEFIQRKIMKHAGYVTSICIISRDIAAGREKPLIVTGSQDNEILVHSMEPGVLEPMQRYHGHTGTISCVIYHNDLLISSSWDSTVRVWNVHNQSQLACLTAHKPAVWTVSGLYPFDHTNRILSGGADRVIKLWEIDTQLCVQEYQGHSDVVRDVKVISSDLFLSAANDCCIRKWNIHTGQSLQEFYAHEAFVYSISPFKELLDDFVSCGEDGTLRVWRGGSCAQTVELPCVSVWSVHVMECGDIVVGGSDSVARVFTLDTTKLASSEHLSNYVSKVADYKASKNQQKIDVKSLPTMESLSRPGKSTGDTKLVNNNGKAEVYQWDAVLMQWQKIGDAIGHAPQDSKQYNGKEYDYLFDIEIDDDSGSMRTLKLPYNKTDDPFTAAENFLADNNLPSYYLDQVAQFILKNADVQYTGTAAYDPYTGGNRYIPGQSSNNEFTLGGGATNDPFLGGSRYKPGDGNQPYQQLVNDSATVQAKSSSDNQYFPMSSYKIFTCPDDYGSKIITKIKEFSSSHPSCVLDEAQLKLIEDLCLSVMGGAYNTTALNIIKTMLFTWPRDAIFPVLDLLRLLVLSNHGNSYFVTEKTGIDLENFLCNLLGTEDVDDKNCLLCLRVLANMFKVPSGAAWMELNKIAIFQVLDALIARTLTRNIQITLSTVVLNYCHKIIHEKASLDHILPSIFTLILKILKQSSYDLEGKYRALIALGTLCTCDKKAVLSCEGSVDLNGILVELCDVSDPIKISECSLHVLQLVM